MSQNYITSICKSYHVISSQYMRLQFDKDINEYLVLSKLNSIEIIKFENDDVFVVCELPIFCQIMYSSCIRSLHPNFPDLLFILSDQMKFAFIQIHKDSLNIIQEGDLENEYVEQLQDGQKRHFTVQKSDGNSRIIGYVASFFYESMLKIIPYKFINGQLSVQKSFNIQISLQNIQDIFPMYQSYLPSNSNVRQYSCNNEMYYQLIGITYQNGMNTLFKIINTAQENEFNECTDSQILGWHIDFKDLIVFKLFTIHDCSLLCFSENDIRIYNQSKTSCTILKDVSIEPYFITSFSENNYLVFEQSGSIYQCILENNKLAIKLLGHIPFINCVSFMGNNLAFLASKLENSFLVKFTDQFQSLNQSNPYIQLLAEFTNLSLISDVIVDVKNLGIYTISPYKTNSINVYQRGYFFELHKKIFLVNLQMLINHILHIYIYYIVNVSNYRINCFIIFFKKQVQLLQNRVQQISNKIFKMYLQCLTTQLFVLNARLLYIIKKILINYMKRNLNLKILHHT